MRSAKTLAVALLSLAALAMSPGRGAAQDKLVLKVADYRPATHPITLNVLDYWMNAVTRATKGAVRFIHYPAGQLGTTRDLLELTRSGVVDIGDVSPAYNTDKLPLSEVAELPGLFATSCEGTLPYWKLATNGGILAKDDWSPLGLRVLIVNMLVPYQIYMGEGRKFENLSDLKGAKLRSAGGPMDLVIQALGSVPVKMPASDVYDAFSRGTLDGLVFPLMAIPAWKLTGFVKTATNGENFGDFTVVFAMREQRWATLPASVQKAMRDAGNATARHGCEWEDESNSADLAALKKRGVNIVKLSAVDQEQIKSRLAPIAQKWAESMDRRGKPGTEVLKAFRAAVPQSR